MSRLRKFTSPIASLSVALLMFASSNAAHRAAAAEAGSTGAGTNWHAANESDNPFRTAAAAEWSPVRPRQTAADAPADDDQEQTPTTNNRPRVSQASAIVVTPHGATSTPPAANTRWQLPNGHQPPAGNRVPGKPATPQREPQPIKPPANATKMSSTPPRTTNVAPWSTPNTSTTANVRPTTSWPPNSTSPAPQSPANNAAAAMRGPAGAESTRYASSQFARPTTPGRAAADPRAKYQPPSRAARGIVRRMDSYSGRMWDSMAVAFQAEDPMADDSVQPESLPMPGSGRPQRGQMMRGGHEMMGPEYDGGYGYDGGPHGSCNCNGPGGCSCPGGCGECGPMCGDGCCDCEPGCGCGCCGEVGCACEPGCGCPNDGCDLNFCGPGDPQACTTIRIGAPKWQEFMLFGGVQGFKGPYDQFRDSGNFGFHEGFNAGFKVPYTSMGYQIGYQAVHSQLSGDKDTDISDPHTQQFATFGVFQRAKDGFQWGLAYDVLRDERWNAVDFHQLRTEISFVDHGCHEWGFAGAFHLNDDEQFFFNSQEEIFSTIYQATDQYLLFYRFHGCNGGEGRFYGGFNDDSDGIIGADTLLPLSNRWSLQAAFTYLIPDVPSGAQGAEQEAWNLSMALVWHWDCAARRCHNNCYRPLFNVADNGYLIVDDRPGSPPTD